MKLQTVKQARESVGGFSNPSKMPCRAISLSIEHCNVGAKLAEVPGTICSKCYAGRGHYARPVVQEALQRRLDALYHPKWVDNMVRGINGANYFRWQDSGDVQDMTHLKNIVEVCDRTPETKHWLPTHETGLVLKYLRDHGEFPSNVCVRLSAVMIDGPEPTFPNTSTVTSKGDHTCPAYVEDGDPYCGDCRKCWDHEVSNVSYPLH